MRDDRKEGVFILKKKKQPTTTKNRGNIEDLNHFIIFYKGISQKKKKNTHASKSIISSFSFSTSS
jgi:hypothetical protein